MTVSTTFTTDSGTEFTGDGQWPGTIRVVLPQAAKSLNHPLLLSTFASEVAQAIAFFGPEDRADLSLQDIAGLQFEVSFQG